ncbi:MAG TPA: hypothetical protein VNG93_00960 [Candidatus Dormibacteraeota bacterium]|nr:hypothetical protein [Candidatus Dormibacteraeota bacterium]
MFRTWLAEGTASLLAPGVPALLATVAAGLLMVTVRMAWSLFGQLLLFRPSPLVVVRVPRPSTPAGGPARPNQRRTF